MLLLRQLLLFSFKHNQEEEWCKYVRKKIFHKIVMSLIFATIILPSHAEEILPAPSLPCFPGAYYRKAASSFDQWTGIEGVIVLPEGTADFARYGNNGPLDKFSIYMGGRANNQEVDAGILWEITKDPFGNIDTFNRAYRPFWRVTSWNNAPATKEYYWYPGERILMRVEVAGSGLLRLTVEDATPNPEKSFSVEFAASQFGVGFPQQFKRVNAIDQLGNEGRPVQPTRAKVVGAIWEEVYLLRGEERFPFVPERFTDMRCPDPCYFVIETYNDKGGEAISIYGNENTE
jgi:hypothetical protein